MKFEYLFRPGKIGRMEIKNRIIKSPLSLSIATYNGDITPKIIAHYREMAKGGAGLVIMEVTYITEKGSQGSPCAVALWNDEFIMGHAFVTEAIHAWGARAGIQLGHNGRQKRLLTKPPIVAPSRVPYEASLAAGGGIPLELTTEEVRQLSKDWAAAARRAKIAGYDLIEIHGASGYLLTEFISQLTNKRNDMYGGSLKNRMRFPLEVVAGVREAIGPDMPISYQVCAEEFESGGIELEETVEFAKELEKAGVDIIHVSGGTHTTMHMNIPTMYQPYGLHVPAAEAIKKVVKVPVIGHGAIPNPQYAEDILKAGKADFISWGRQFLSDPAWPRKAQEGRVEDIRPCIRCLDGCLERWIGTRCSVNAAVCWEDERTDEVYQREAKLNTEKRKIAVIGGGPAGLEAARVAALRGHQVTLYEMRELGGMLIEDSVPEFKKDLRPLTAYLATQMKKLGVHVVKRQATKETIQKGGFDAVIVGTGANLIIPQVPGVDKPIVTDIFEVYRSKGKGVGEKVVIIGDGMTGCELALYLAQMGKKPIVTGFRGSMAEVAAEGGRAPRAVLLDMLKKREVPIRFGLVLIEVTDNSAVFVDRVARKHILEADTIVLATGLTPETKLAEELEKGQIPVYRVGDCVKPRRIYDAIHSGHDVGARL
ncbi:MAG: FAD-dependent oxidoreductase [Dehalococcoidia bacterium]|nr:FAD-dependent oxidoreductase [Dehalococcoidia bacterium]